MRVSLVFLAVLVLGCGGAPANGEEPSTERPSASATPRHARATRGGATVEITDTPGLLIDGNAPPPPPGTPPATHAALTASCIGDVTACSEAGSIVRGAASFDAAVEGLRGIGFEVAHGP